jgi:hypothetical protein
MKFLESIAMRTWVAGFKAISTRCEYCQRSMTLHNFSAHKAGIRMRDRWYCSSSCFGSAVEAELAELAVSGQERAMPVSSMPLGLMLVGRGLLSNEELREARLEQKETGEEIGDLLVRRGSLSEKQLTAARASQWGCPVYSAPRHGLPTDICIPSTFMRIYSMIPLHHVASKNLLLVGFVNKVEYGLLYAIEKMTGCRTQPCFVTPSDFHLQMQQREQAQEQGDADSGEVKFECVQSLAEMARILSSYGAHLEADEAIIGKCREYLWARLKTGPKEVDLLFKAS